MDTTNLNNEIDANQLIPTDEIIKLAKESGVKFGFGDTRNRIRYLVKNGLLPHQVRKVLDGKITPHLPYLALAKLVEIQDLQNKFKYTIPQLIAHFNDAEVKTERSKYDVENVKIDGDGADVAVGDKSSTSSVPAAVVGSTAGSAAVASTFDTPLDNKEPVIQEVQPTGKANFGNVVANNKASELEALSTKLNIKAADSEVGREAPAAVKGKSHVKRYVIVATVIFLMLMGVIAPGLIAGRGININWLTDGLSDTLGFFRDEVQEEIPAEIDRETLSQDNTVQEGATGNVEIFGVNIPAFFSSDVTFGGSVNLNNQDLNLGSGDILASNVIYSIVAGDGMQVSAGQNPVITNTGVLSVGGATGDVELEAGDGIEVDGTEITNIGVLSLAGETGDLELTGGADIDINGLEVNLQTVLDTVTQINLPSNSSTALRFGNIGLGEPGVSNTDSGAYLIGVFDEFDNTNETNLQALLEDFDNAITVNGHDPVTFVTNGFDYITLSGQQITLNAIDLDTDVINLLATENGGLGADVTAAGAGEILYSTGTTSYDSVAAGGVNQVLTSGGAAAPSWNNITALISEGDDIDVTGTTAAVVSLEDAIDVTSVSASTENGISFMDNGGNLGVFVEDGGFVGIATTNPSALFAVGDNSQFRVNSSGNITRIGGVNHTISDSSGNLSFVSLADMLFDDSTLTSAVQLSDTDTTLPNGNIAIVDAINDAYEAATGGGSGGLWTLAGNVIYPTVTTNDFAIGGTDLANAMFSIDESTGIFQFGADNSANPALRFEATDSDQGEFGFNTNDSFYFTGANVGIGTSAPSERLTITNNNYIGSTNAANDATLRLLGLDTNNRVALAPAGGESYFGGNLGVGTTDPAERLDVNGNLRVQGSIAGDSTLGRLSLYADREAAVLSGIHLLDTGNLGIGTSGPESRLTVAGGATIGSGITGIGISAPTQGLLVQGFTGIGTTNPGSLFAVGNNSQFQISSSGNIVRVNGIATVFPNSQGAIGSILTNDGSGNLSWSGTSGSVGFWQRNYDSILSPATITDNVGIGTTGAESRLTVSGNASIGSSYTGIGISAPVNGLLVEGRVGIGTTSPFSKLTINTGATGTVGLAIGGISGQTADLTQWSAPAGTVLSVVSAQGYFGIGVTSPFARLDLLAAGDQDTPVIRLRQSNSQTYGFDLGIDNNQNGGLFFRANNNGTFTNSMVIARDTGNVGIGITAPQARLEVSGTTWLRGTGFNGLFVNSNGRVGIGTTAPESLLSVAGSGTFGSGYTGIGISAPLNGLLVQGNVGIGNTNPSQKLSVAGTLGIVETGASPTHYTVFQGGDQSGNITYTLPTTDGEGDYVLATDGNGVLSWQSVTGVGAGAGDITAVNAGSGLIGGGTVGDVTLNVGAGNGITVNSDDISIKLATSGGVGSTASFSGLEVGSDGLSVLTGCSDENILIWNDADSLWECTAISAVTGVSGGGTDNYIPRWNGSTALNDSIIYQSDAGNVGIGGGTAPESKLTIAGNATIGAGYTGIGISAPLNGLLVQGNVGIGVTNPRFKLDVSGAARVRDLLTDKVILADSSANTIAAQLGFKAFTNFSGGIGTGSIDSTLGTQRLTASGNLTNIGSIQAGETLLTSAGTFGVGVGYTAGTYPYMLDSGDLNADGDTDIVVGNRDGGNISVLIGNGDGTFATKVDYTAGTNPYQNIIGDVNGDAMPDIATFNDGSDTMSIFINDGDGTFAAKVDYTTEEQPHSGDLADFNNDGKLDAVSVGRQTANVSVFINNGDGTYASRVNYSVGSGPSLLDTGDVNGDGFVDIITGNVNTDTVSVILNDGDGTFGAASSYNSASNIRGLKMGDLNGDGALDILSSGTSAVSVSLNDGDGTFAAKVDYTIDGAAFDMSIKDITGDGKADVVATAFGAAEISVFRGNGDGTLAAKVDYSTPSDASIGVTLSDFNGDGKLDMAYSLVAAEDVMVRLNQPTPMFYAQASTGRIGIGTTGPESLLTVAGGGTFGSGYTGIGISAPLNGLLVQGNVGIGNTNPFYKLDVNGDVRVASSFDFYKGTIGLGHSASATASGAFVIGAFDEFGNSDSNTIQDVLDDLDAAITAATHDPVTFVTNGFDYLTLTDQEITLNAIDLDTDVINTLPTANGGLNADVTPAGAGELLYSVSASAYGSLPAGNSGQLLISGGAASPSWANITSHISAGDDIDVTGTTTATVALEDAIDVSTIAASSVLGLKLTDDGGNLGVFVEEGGQVGIGTSSPGFELDVTGTFRVTGNSTLGDASADTVTSNAATWTFANDTNFVLSGGVAGLTFDTSTFAVDATNDRIGIGTTAPESKLAVAGGATIGSGYTGIGISAPLNGLLVQGNVGIGVTNPRYKLDVSGVGRASNLLSQSLLLSESVTSTLLAQAGFNGYTSFTGGIGTGGIGKDGMLGAQRLTSGGNLVNIGSIQAGEAFLTTGGTFASKVDYVTGTQPQHMATGDVNLDGKLDLITGNYGGNSASVLLNNGDGTFASKVDYTTGNGPIDIAVGDVNGDGIPDIVTANQPADTMSVLINDGDGTFAAKVDYTTGDNPWSIDIGDVNNDGKADVAVANQIAGTASVFINEGNGTFAAKVDYTTGDNPESVAIGDFDGDGYADMVTANSSTANLSAFINNGDGTFAAKVDYTTGSNGPNAVLIVDMDMDGQNDLVATTGADVSVYTNDGDGTFAAKVDYATGGFPYSLGAGDLNGDGAPDITTANYSLDQLVIFLNNGDGTLASAVTYSTGSEPLDTAVGDFNGDGKPDVATPNFNDADVSVFLNLPTPMLFAQASTGRVGIGTTTPGALFAVGTSNGLLVNSSGNITRLNGITTSFPSVQGSAGSVLTNDGSGTLSWSASSGTGTIGYWQRVSTTVSPATVTDNVGIGVTNSTSKLSVAGGVSIGSGYQGIGISAPTQGLLVQGNVGIGTTAPRFALDVNGHIGPNVNDTYDLGSDSFRFRDLYLGPDTLHIGTSTSDEMAVSYNTTNNYLGFNINGSGADDFVFDSNGRLGIGTTSPVTRLHVTGGDLLVDNDQGFSSRTTAGAIHEMLRLDSNNDMLVNASALSGSASNLYAAIGLNKVFEVRNSSDAPLLTVSESNGFVGIGITNPSTAFQVMRDADTVSVANLRNPNTGTSAGVSLSFTADSGYNGLIGQMGSNYTGISGTAGKLLINAGATSNGIVLRTGSTSVPLSFRQGSTEVMTLNSGNVGIGTTVPARLLDISSATSPTMRISNTKDGTSSIGDIVGSLEFYSADSSGFGAGVVSSISLVNNNLIGTARALTFNLTNASGNNAEAMRIDVNGYLGIGTTSPQEKLAVAGNAIIGQGVTAGISQLYIGSTTGTADKALLVEYDNTYNNARLRIAGDSSPLGLTIADGGNIGIGTTGPRSMLHLQQGDLRFTTASAGTQGIVWDESGALDVMRLVYNGAGTGANNRMEFVRGTGLGTAEALMVIQGTTGNVGIGTTVPVSKLDVVSSDTTGGLRVIADSITTGTGADMSFDGLTSGTGLSIASTSTVLTTGGLVDLDWSPTGSTEIYATGDLFSINVGQYGNVGNVFALYDNASTLFKVSQAQIESAVPHLFSAAGDVSIANDLVLTNQTSGNINSYGPLTITSGESFENQNLALQTYGTGNLALNLGTSGNVIHTATDASYIFNTRTATDTDFWMGVMDDGGSDDDDIFSIGDGTVAGTNPFLSIDTSGNVGIGTTGPSAYYHGGTNRVLEIQNSGTSSNSQAHLILSTGATSNIGSVGSISWMTPNSTSNKGVAYIGALTTTSAATNATGAIVFATAGAATPAERMRIMSNGNVGIGTTGGSLTRLLVHNDNANGYAGYFFHDGNATTRPGIGIQAGLDSGVGASKMITFFDGDGTEVGDITNNNGTVSLTAFTGSHKGELPEEDNEEGYPYGTVLCITETNSDETYQPTYKVVKCNEDYQSSVFGVYAYKDETKDNEHGIYSVGDGHVLVTAENGEINRGDNIAASSFAGYGMKAVEAGTIIAVATADWDEIRNIVTVELPNGDEVEAGLMPVSYYPGVWYSGPSQLATIAELGLETGDHLVLDTNDDADTYLTHDAELDRLSVMVDGTETFRFSPTGNSSNGSISTSLSDLAESYPTMDSTLEPGDVVVLDTPSEDEEADISKYLVAKSGAENKSKVLGVVTSKPGLLMGAGEFRAEQCKLVDEDEDQARENLITKEIRILAETTVDAEIEEGISDEDDRADSIVDLIDELTEKYEDGEEVLDAGVLSAIEDSIAVCKSTKQVDVALAGRIPVKYDTSNGEIEAGDLLAVSEVEPGRVVKAEEAGWVVGRALEASSEDTGMIMMFVNLSWFSGDSEALAFDTEEPGDIEGLDEILEIQDNDEGGKRTVFFSDMNITGDVTAKSFSTLGEITAGFLKIDGSDDSISVIGGGDLKLQNGVNPGNIEAFNGELLLTAEGGIIAKGDIEAESVAARKFMVLGAATEDQSASIGEGTITAGTTEVVIMNTNATPTSKIFVTATTDTGDNTLVVANKIDGAFVVKIKQSILTDIKFDYWIVGVKEASL